MRIALYVVVTLIMAVLMLLIRYTVLSMGWGVVGLSTLVVMVIALLLWLIRSLARRGYAGRMAGRIRSGWLIVILLLVGYGVLVYFKYPWHEKLTELSDEEVKSVLQLVQKNACTTPESAGDMFMINITSKCPAVVKMNPNQMIVWWGDKSKFRTGWYFQRRATPIGRITHDKFRVFQPRKGVGQVKIKIHRYYDPDPLWYTRQ